jgi:Aminoacyl-tRNA editing domain
MQNYNRFPSEIVTSHFLGHMRISRCGYLRSILLRPSFKSFHHPQHPYLAVVRISTMSVADTVSRLSTLRISHSAPVKHGEATSPATWKDALANSDSVPQSYKLIKTLVFKPKTAKNATPIPVIVIASEDTETSSATLSKKLNLKDLRLAPEDLLTSFFGIDKDACECIFHPVYIVQYSESILTTNTARSSQYLHSPSHRNYFQRF